MGTKAKAQDVPGLALGTFLAPAMFHPDPLGRAWKAEISDWDALRAARIRANSRAAAVSPHCRRLGGSPPERLRLARDGSAGHYQDQGRASFHCSSAA